MELKKIKQKLLADEKFRKQHYKKDFAVEIGEMVITARVRLGITQTELAKRVGTKQPSIARLESGNRIPDLGFLQRVAVALGMHLAPPKFVSNSYTIKFPAGAAQLRDRHREKKRPFGTIK